VGERVSFVQGNLFEQDISKADVLTMYLLQTVNIKLRPKILAELKPGSRVVSHVFSMDEWQSDQHDNLRGHSIYLWVVPGKAEGTWEAESTGRKFTLSLRQTFQKLTGRATAEGKSTPVSGRLMGNAIELTLDVDGKPTALRGVIKDGAIEGGNLRARRS